MASNSDALYWRETYFIVFPQDRRPQLDQVTAAIRRANARFQLENPAADGNGLIQSLLVESPEDHAAVEISFEVGDAVIEQNLQWAKELRAQLPAKQLQALMKADARLDVAHYERLPAGEEPGPITSGGGNFGDDFGGEFEDEPSDLDMLDPTCLLTVVDALAELTHGLTFDPASGEILS